MKNIWQKTFLLFNILIASNLLLMAQAAKNEECSTGKTVSIVSPTTDFKFSQNNIDSDDESFVEKAIAVDPKVNVSFCSVAREVNVRGWQRDEVRVFVEDGTAKIGFKVMQRGDDSKPEWIIVQGLNAKSNVTNADEECLRGDSILIEVPINAKVAVKSRDSHFTFDSLARVKISNVSGDVELRNITQEIDVSSLAGSLLAEDSSGKITLKSIEGDIMASRLKPNDFSDTLKFNSTSGNVVLRNVLHKNIEAASNSGEVAIFDSLVRGGSYDFNTVNGMVLLTLPADFSFQIKATVNAGGGFHADFPIKINAQKLSGQSRLFTATNGSGESAINLTTFNGSLQLHKK